MAVTDGDSTYHLHLISDATGDTLETMVKAALVQFEGADVIKHFWPMVRSVKQLDRVVREMAESPGLVVFTIVDTQVRDALLAQCRSANLPVISVLDPLIQAFAGFFDQAATELPGRQYVLDSEYFDRIDALHFSMAHDDGQMKEDLGAADIVLVGVSRTSKTPTCIYLANRGLKAANVPFVAGCSMPEELDSHLNAFVVGLTAAPERLVQIRTNRLRSINEETDTDYVDLQAIREEVAACRKYCSRHGWPVIDVTRRSIEETSAAILALHGSARPGFS